MRSLIRKIIDSISYLRLKFKGVKFGKAVDLINVRFMIIGENVSFGNNVRLQASNKIVVMDNSYIGHNNHIYGGNIIIGKDFMSGPNVCIMAGNHGKKLGIPMNKQDTNSIGIIIGDDVWVGSNSTILDGVRVGDHVVIGAGSVVTRDLPKFSICVGNPAHPVSYRI